MVKYPVRSSQLKFIAYDPATQELRVEFVNGGTYAYSRVPSDTVARVMFSKSVGSTFHELVKKAGYPHVLVVSTTTVSEDAKS